MIARELPVDECTCDETGAELEPCPGCQDPTCDFDCDGPYDETAE